jgi:hypothetical protein
VVEVRQQGWLFVAAGLAAGLLACSGGGDNSAQRGSGGSGAATTGSGGSAAPSGSGGTPDFGNGSGSGGSANNGMATAPPPVPPVDPSAAPFMKDDTASSGVDPATITALKNGGASCNVTVTFPYEGTMFPGGLPSPIVMYDGAADAVYLHFTYNGSDKVDYQFAAPGSNPGEVQIPRDAWNEITRRTNNQTLNVTLNT